MKLLSAIVFLTLASSAFADQCAVVSKKQAVASMEFLKPGTKIGFLCEKCGETKMKKSTVSSVSVAKFADRDATDLQGNKIVNPTTIKVNGKMIDLAYTYYLANGTTYYNIAGLVGCDTTDVSFNLPAKK